MVREKQSQCALNVCFGSGADPASKLGSASLGTAIFPLHDWQVCLGPCKHPVRVLSIENNYVAIMPLTIIY